MAGKKKNSKLYLLTGLCIGIMIGLLVGWKISPVTYFDITPASLHEDFQKEYLVMVALSYEANGDIGRARARIQEMSDPINKDLLRSYAEQINLDPEMSDSYSAVLKLVNSL